MYAIRSYYAAPDARKPELEASLASLRRAVEAAKAERGAKAPRWSLISGICSYNFV